MATQTNNPEFTVVAGAALSPFRLIDRTGNHTAGNGFDNPIGVNQETVASASLARARRLRAGTCKITASGAIKVGQRCYSAASGKISATRAGRYVGRALEAATADLDVIEVDTQAPEGGLLFSQTAAGTVITNTAVETVNDQSVTLPVDDLQPGDELQIDVSGTVVAQNGTDTTRCRLRIGGLAGTALFDSGAVNAAAGAVLTIRCRLKIRTAGAGGTLVADGVGVLAAAAGTPVDFKVASTAIDTTAVQNIVLTTLQGAANAGNQWRQDDLVVKRITD